MNTHYAVLIHFKNGVTTEVRGITHIVTKLEENSLIAVEDYIKSDRHYKIYALVGEDKRLDVDRKEVLFTEFNRV